VSLLHALVLGIVQGLTEFIPVSSSGHLQLVPFVFGWKQPTVAFDVAVHFGTLVAVVYVFRDEVMRWVRAALHWRDASAHDRMVLRLVVIGTVPAVVVGAAFNHWIEDTFQKPVVISLLLGVTGYLLMSAETRFRDRERPPRPQDAMTERDAIVIGGWQAVAILPGISRSGATIGGAMRRGLARDAAARFSFLLSIPVIAGAIVFKLPDIGHQAAATGAGAFIVGVVSSALFGFLAVGWFLRMIRIHGLRPFGIYCFLAMTAGLLTALARG
jgi:undecaprenyl-diphosphatase